MYDPQCDYDQAGAESPAAAADQAVAIFDERPAFCFRCGCELTRFTFQQLERVVFCTTCAADHEESCLRDITVLNGDCGEDILVNYKGCLWLAPAHVKWRHQSMASIVAIRSFLRQYSPE